MDILELAIEELLLDQENPRIGNADSQSAALEALVRLNERNFVNMMLSIKENGLDPGDSFYVIKHEDGVDYVVVEGNRRFAALRVLDNPELVQSTSLSDPAKRRLVRAAEGFDASTFEPIRCVVFEDRLGADKWIERRHAGAMEGEGRIEWGSVEKQRFSADHTVLDIVDFVERNSALPEAEWQKLRKAVLDCPSSGLLRQMVV